MSDMGDDVCKKEGNWFSQSPTKNSGSEWRGRVQGSGRKQDMHAGKVVEEVVVEEMSELEDHATPFWAVERVRRMLAHQIERW